MEAASELQTFLQAHRAEGEQKEEGEFTVAREKALSKMAEFQLPFKGAWALKMVQAAVAGGVAQAIRVDQTYSETRFYFSVSAQWKLSTLEDAFFEPEPEQDRSLDHLKRALWTVGLNQKRPFQINLPGFQDMLVWTGERLLRVPCPSTYNCFFLAVSHRPASQKGLLGKLDFWTSAEENAEVMKALADHAFVCPVPLTVDSRRLDALQYCPGHGLGSASHPLVIRYLDNDLPKLHLSPGNFRETKNRDQHYKAPRYQKLSEPVVCQRDALAATSLAYFVTYHAARTKVNDKTVWVESPHSSTCHWIQDGVCVETEDFGPPASSVSIGLFLSAEGIANDLTSLKLRWSEQRVARGRMARAEVQRDLQLLKAPSFRKASLSGNEGGWLGGVLLVVGGVALLPLSVPAALVAGAGGLFAVQMANSEAKEFQQTLGQAFQQTQRAWNDLKPS
jgi:hypothetical protein